MSELAAPAFAGPEAADAPESAPEDADAGDDEDDAEAQAKSKDAKPKDAAREAGESPEGPAEAPPEREALQARFRQMERAYRSEDDAATTDKDSLVAGAEAAPRDPDRQNKQFRAICNQLGLNADQRRQLHDEITGCGLNCHEIRQRAIDMFGKNSG